MTPDAILRRRLAGTGLTEPQWVTLSLVVADGGTVDGDELTGRVAGILNVSDAQARALITDLASAELLQPADGEGSRAKLSDAGRRLHRTVLEQACTELADGDAGVP
jgi:hypothetical protein